MMFSGSPLQKRILLLLALLVGVAGLYELLPGTRLRAKHTALIEWAHRGAPGAFPEDFAAAGYTDQWEQSAAAVAERVRSARFAFPGLTITADEPEYSRDGNTATVRQKLKISGADVPREAVITFRWQKESWLPWGWRLVRVDAPELEL